MIARENSPTTPAGAEGEPEEKNPPVIGVTRPENGENQQKIPDTIPILPVRNMVVFPGTVVPLTVGRGSSRKLLQESLPQSKVIGIFSQRNPEQNEPAAVDLHQVGTAGLVLKLIRQ